MTVGEQEMALGPARPRIYLAGASKELELCEHWRDELRRVGFEITHDWMVQVRKASAADGDIPYVERQQHARNDLGGIGSADAVWLVVPATHVVTIGMWVEMGYALRLKQARTDCVLCMSGPWRTIFQDVVLPGWSFSEHQRAFVQLCDVFGPRLVATAP